MALKAGKKTVKLKPSLADNIGIPKFADTNIAAEISKPISEAIDSFRKVAEADAAVDFKVSFNNKTRDHYINLQDKFKFDPDGMKNAVDSFSKTTLANTPIVYRDYAANIIAQKNLANMNFATKNYRARNDQMVLDGFNESRSNFENDYIFQSENIVENNLGSVNDINNHTANTHFINLNEVYGSAGETLVATNRYSGIKLNKNLDEDLKNTEILRVYNIMRKLPTQKALTYFDSYMKGNDSAAIKVDNFEDANKLANPVFKKYEEYIRNPMNREDIGKEVLNLYEDHNGKTVSALTAGKTNYDLDGEKDVGGKLHAINFTDGKVSNAHDYMQVNFPGIKNTQYKDGIEYVQKNIDIGTKVNSALEGNKVQLMNDDESKLFTQHILARNGINNTNLTNVQNENLAVAIDILKRQDIVPQPVIKRLNTKVNADFNNPGMVKEFRENLSLYNYMKRQYPNLDVENAFIYDEANNLLAEGMSDDKLLGARLNTLAGDAKNYTANKEKINTNLESNVSRVTKIYADIISDMDINTDTNFIKKFFLSEKNRYTDIFEPSGTTVLPTFASTLVTPEVRAVWLQHTLAVATHLNGGKEFDITNRKGEDLFRQAASIALDRIDKAGYGASRFTYSGRTELQKDPFEKYAKIDGQGLENSIIAQANYLDSILSEEEKKERFGINIDTGLPIIGKTKLKANNIVDIVKTAIDKNMEGIVIEPTGTYNNAGTPNYHLKINHDGYTINLTEGVNYFDPTGFAGMSKIQNKNATRGTLINNLAEKKYKMFEQTYGHLLDGRPYEDFAKGVIYKTIKLGIEASDYKFYPDIPLLNDVPAEVKPFAFIFKALGIDADLKPYYDEGAKINNEISKHLSYDAQIEANSKLTTTDKKLEAAFPPHETEYTRTNVSLKFKNWAYSNYENKSIPLPMRTNNYMAVMKTDSAWNGEITDISTGNQAAIFSSPVDSIRAGLRVMINNSTLINNNTTKRYGNEPTIEEVLSVYAEDTSIYLTALEEKTSMTRDDVINFFDNNQMFDLIKFMIEHEMGSEAFNTYYPPGNQQFLDAMIMEGYNLGINSYGGKLGKIR